MAFVAFSGSVSGQGSNTFAATDQILFVAVHLSALGLDVRSPDLGITDHILRAGWFSLGDHFDNGSGTAYDYWRAPVWCDFPNTLWTPIPTHEGTGFAPTTLVASRIRWSFGPGTSGYLEVFAL